VAQIFNEPDAFLRPNQQRRSTEGNKSTDPNHEKSPTGLILSSSIIGLLWERVVLLPLCWFSNVRTPTLHHNMISTTAKHNSSYLSERFDCDLFAALTAGKRR